MEQVLVELKALAEEPYACFQRKLMPTVLPELVLGVRMPALRRYAKRIQHEGSAELFIQALPHRYYEENNLHGLLLCEIQDFECCLAKLEEFLPFVDNWATCDLLRPRCFAAHKTELLPHLRRWLSSDHPYTIRFAIEMLMIHYLRTDFREEYLQWVSKVDSKEYYVNMMIAWYFATALAFQYSAALPYLEQYRLPMWIHQKTIQKAVESYRIAPEQKTYLRSLRRKV